MTLSFVNDDLDKSLGPDRAQEVREAIQPTGDCASCGKRLGPDRIRVDVRTIEPFTTVYARHAACMPAPTGNFVVSVPTTYQVNSFVVPRQVNSEQAPRSSFFRRRQLEPPVLDAMVVVNPAIDGFTFTGPDDRSLLDPFRRRGFVQPGTAKIGDPAPANAASISFTVKDETLILTDRGDGARYEVADDPRIVDPVRQSGGGIVFVTFRHWSSQLTDPPSVISALSDVDGVVQMWVPLDTTGTW